MCRVMQSNVPRAPGRDCRHHVVVVGIPMSIAPLCVCRVRHQMVRLELRDNFIWALGLAARGSLATSQAPI